MAYKSRFFMKRTILILLVIYSFYLICRLWNLMHSLVRVSIPDYRFAPLQFHGTPHRAKSVSNETTLTYCHRFCAVFNTAMMPYRDGIVFAIREANRKQCPGVGGLINIVSTMQDSAVSGVVLSYLPNTTFEQFQWNPISVQLQTRLTDSFDYASTVSIKGQEDPRLFMNGDEISILTTSFKWGAPRMHLSALVLQSNNEVDMIHEPYFIPAPDIQLPHQQKNWMQLPISNDYSDILTYVVSIDPLLVVNHDTRKHSLKLIFNQVKDSVPDGNFLKYHFSGLRGSSHFERMNADDLRLLKTLKIPLNRDLVYFIGLAHETEYDEMFGLKFADYRGKFIILGSNRDFTDFNVTHVSTALTFPNDPNDSSTYRINYPTSLSVQGDSYWVTFGVMDCSSALVGLLKRDILALMLPYV